MGTIAKGCVVKLTGQRNLVEAITELLEGEYVTVGHPRILSNDKDDGVHTFVSIIERREVYE